MKEESKIENFYLIKPLKYSLIKSINLYRDIVAGEQDYNIEIEMISDEYEILKLRFLQSKEIEIKEINNYFASQIEIRNIKDRMLENISFSVVEEEENLFSFKCKDFNFEIIKK